MQECSNKSCFVHDGESCALGHATEERCPSWSQAAPVDASKELPEAAAETRVCWSGNALGLSDLMNLTPRAQHRVIGVLGAENAGKTTFLLANYLALMEGKRLSGARFAGSRTLGAWESLAAWTRMEDAARRPSFPPHTPRSADRVPGLLHVALRAKDDSFRDILLTDAPGEWFRTWALDANAVEVEGARWIERHADAFIVLADSARLSGPKRGSARNELRQLLIRLGNHASGRPTTVVWAKSDQPPPKGIQRAIHRCVEENLSHAEVVDASVREPSSLVAALESVLDRVWTQERAQPITTPRTASSPFAAYRGRRADP